MGAVALLAGFSLLGCAALPEEVGGTSASTPVARAAPQEESFRLNTRVWGEGNEVRVEGVVDAGASSDEGGHVDIAVYGPGGSLLATASAPYLAAGTAGGRSPLKFSARLPDLRGRKIRLRMAPHGVPVGDGETCTINTALQGDGR